MTSLLVDITSNKGIEGS